MFEHRGLNNSRTGVMRFELFREVLEDVMAVLSQGRVRHYTGTLFCVRFYFIRRRFNTVEMVRAWKSQKLALRKARKRRGDENKARKINIF